MHSRVVFLRRLANVPVRERVGEEEDELLCSRCRGEGRGNGGGAARGGHGPLLFPGVEVLLELGARVADVEALLADCVVAMETDQHSICGRVNPLSGP